MHDLLLLEPDDLLRDVLHHALEDAGFRVQAAALAGEALSCLRSPRSARLLLANLDGADGLAGFAIIDAVRTERPDLPILYHASRRTMPDTPRCAPQMERLARPVRLLDVLQAIGRFGVSPGRPSVAPFRPASVPCPGKGGQRHPLP
ncbi:hypothetical protein J8J14_06595 [Roseomonas sp. SSH11]|uniref:Response regulatory domain-containing protein n=1 Tax=Pararoseomonas baculiformis TaxID=2820812 RepID=A0ABS4AD25_9PROT|nr:hypothetical protein [Pararoseomonas baculiformis]MBP0444445.1 hypothetical protein [Pararoseomonas baculiformis]